jgi:hypothetical protein
MVLRGAGATLFLPFLPSAMPRSAWGAKTTAPVRLMVCVVPNGIYTPAWQPLASGANYDLPGILAPMAALQSRFSVISGTQNMAEEEGGPTHDGGMGSLLTDTVLTNVLPPLENGVSFDQVAADAFGANAPFRSMQLGVQNTGFIGSSGYVDKVSWGQNDTPYPPVLDPRTAFNRMFGLDGGMTEAEIDARAAVRTSILDRVLERTTTLRTNLASADAQKLDQYQTAVRELELQIARLEGIACVAPEEPPTNPAFGEATQIMYDLMFKAFECDLTRYITFLQGPSATAQVYSHLGLTTDDHSLSHQSWDLFYANAVGDRVTMQSWQVEMFANFMQKLADTTDFDGSDLLSNTICVFTSEFGDANLHEAYGEQGQPIGIGGGENSGIVQGLHRAVGAQSHANVWLALLNHLGIEQTTFGTFGTTPVDLTTTL